MARPRKAVVDYFPHDTSHGCTMQVIEARWGNDGYAFWFKLLELLGTHNGHFIDCRKPAEWEFLTAKTRLSDVTATEILDMLSKLDAINGFLWESYRVIYCANFVFRIGDAYRKRINSLPSIERVYSDLNITKEEFPAEETTNKEVSGNINGEREREREREIKEKTTTAAEQMLTSECQKLYIKHYGRLDSGKITVLQKIVTNFPRDKIVEAFESVSAQAKKPQSLNWVIKRLEGLSSNSKDDAYWAEMEARHGSGS
jgi:hypothetical protein